MSISVVGLNYQTANAELRGRVSFRRSDLKEKLHELQGRYNVDGCVIVSTCNRTELYVSTPSPVDADCEMRQFLLEEKDVSVDELDESLYSAYDAAAIRHLFTVVSSLDSMVLGEQQIIGQTRSAFRDASHAGTVNMALTRLFRQAMECGKRVRTQTAISESHVSVSTVAIDIAKRMFDTFEDKKVLVVGAGEASELAARYLKEQGVQAFIVSSRTREHAIALAEELGGTARRFEDLSELISDADIVVSGTAAQRYIIKPEMLANVKKELLILDIAIPRDVDPACAQIPGVTVCDLDAIGAEIARNKDQRTVAAEQAREIVEDETQKYLAWAKGYEATPLIKEMRLKAEQVRQNEVAHLLKTLDADLSEKDLKSLELATSAIVNKLLHQPTVCMRESATDRAGYETIDAARQLFGLTGSTTKKRKSRRR